MKLHVALHKYHHLADGSWSHGLEVYTQPTWRRLVAKIYHWYDMRIFKVPGFRRLERWLESRHQGDPLLYVPLSCRQDIRCYDLGIAGRKVAATVSISEEEYDKIRAARRDDDPGDSV